MFELDNELDIVGKDSIADLFAFVDRFYEDARLQSKQDPVGHFMATRTIIEVSQAIHLYAKSKEH